MNSGNSIIQLTHPERPECVKDEYLEYLDSVWAIGGSTSDKSIQDKFDVTLEEATLIGDFWAASFRLRNN